LGGGVEAVAVFGPASHGVAEVPRCAVEVAVPAPGPPSLVYAPEVEGARAMAIPPFVTNIRYSISPSKICPVDVETREVGACLGWTFGSVEDLGPGR